MSGGPVVLYEERWGSRNWFWLPTLAWVVIAGLSLATTEDGAAQAFRDGSWLILVFLGVLVLPFFALGFSFRRYHNITVDTEALRVGRHVVPLAQLDPSHVCALRDSSEAGMAQRLTASTATWDTPWDRAAARGEPSILGGAWGIPAGADSVVLRDRSQREFQVATKDRRAFIAALATATGCDRERP